MLRYIHQNIYEDEKWDAARLSTAAAIYFNVHSADEKITFFVGGLKESMKTLVDRYR